MLPPYKAAVVLALAHLPGTARAAQDLTLDANTRAAIQEAEAELFELRPDHLGNSRYSQLPKDLFCDTCQRAISVLQQARDEEMQKPEEERSRHAVHLGYHIKRLHTKLCHVKNFEGQDSARMHVTCKHLLDHWDDAHMEAASRDENPWHVYRGLLATQGADPPDAAFRKAELTALCATANYPPCAVDDLKDEL